MNWCWLIVWRASEKPGTCTGLGKWHTDSKWKQENCVSRSLWHALCSADIQKAGDKAIKQKKPIVLHDTRKPFNLHRRQKPASTGVWNKMNALVFKDEKAIPSTWSKSCKKLLNTLFLQFLPRSTVMFCSEKTEVWIVPVLRHILFQAALKQNQTQPPPRNALPSTVFAVFRIKALVFPWARFSWLCLLRQCVFRLPHFQTALPVQKH